MQHMKYGEFSETEDKAWHLIAVCSFMKQPE